MMLFQGLLAAGIPFVAVLTLGIYAEQRWSDRQSRIATTKLAHAAHPELATKQDVAELRREVRALAAILKASAPTPPS